MIGALTILLLFQLVGEAIVYTLHLPVPGPVVGMLLLFATLMVRGSLPSTLKDTAQGLLKQLNLLFVPAGVGVMAHFALIRAEWFAMFITLVSSTLITIAVTALTMNALVAKGGKHEC